MIDRSKDKLISIEGVLKRQPEMPIATSRKRNWKGVTVDVHAPIQNLELNVPALDHHVVYYLAVGSGRLLQKRLGSTYESILVPGDVVIMPAGNTSSWYGSVPGAVRIRIPTQLLAHVAKEVGMDVDHSPELRNVFRTRDVFIGHLSKILSGELDRPEDPSQAIISSSASDALAAHLLRCYDVEGINMTSVISGLNTRALNRVIDYIENHTETPVTLNDLAKVAKVSRFHFSRLFKVSTGMSPIAFVEQSRIHRAKEMILAGQMSLAEIALAVGFADQSHFTRRFVAHTGMTPAAFARR